MGTGSATGPSGSGSGGCSVCLRSMSVTSAGVVRIHGPGSSRCPGSGRPPRASDGDKGASVSVISSPHGQECELPPSVADSQDQVEVSTGDSSGDGSGCSPLPNKSMALLKRLPHGSRDQAARKLASIVDSVVAANDHCSWRRLLHFASRCFKQPCRGGRRWNFTSAVNCQISEEADPELDGTSSSSKSKPKKPKDPLESLATRVASKLEDGNYKGAVRLACADDTLAEHSAANLEALKQKHPELHPDSIFDPAPDSNLFTFAITEQDMRRTILSFPEGSAGGPDGLRPQHLKDLTATSAKEGGQLLLKSLCSLISLILRGETPSAIRPHFFGATLVALRKKDGSIRPIAVGCTLRRLAAKCASSFAMKSMPELLAPRQLGFGVSRGVEAAVHAARTVFTNLQQDQAIVKVDFKNAFNSVRRDKMLAAVEELIPDLLPFVHSVYCSPSFLRWGEDEVLSAEGVQQGDPLGPLLFCLTIHKLCSKLSSDFATFYLDDGTLGGHRDDIISDLLVIEEEAGSVGLQLNRTKSELICSDPTTRGMVLSKFPGLRVVSMDSAMLLGSPLGTSACVDKCISEKVQSLRLMGERISLLHSHDALTLLRHSLAIPKLLHILRTAPCFTSPSLQEYDATLRSILSDISNIHLSKSSWLQATLPVNRGGLGIRSAVHLAPSAFLASAEGSADLVQLMLPTSLHASVDPLVTPAMSLWQEGHQQPPPASSRQKVWDFPRVKAREDHLLSSAPGALSRARLIASSAPESGAWLNALPISSLGLRMSDDTIRIAIGLRLGAPLCLPHQCEQCGEHVDQWARHGLSCKKSQGRHSRHAALNDVIHRSMVSAKIPSRLEPSGLLRSDGKRPDGMSIVPWSSGRLLVWDVTCTDTFAASNIVAAISGTGAVAKKAEELKVSKYSHLDSTYLFVPVAVETTGVFGPQSLHFIRDLGRRLRSTNGEPNSLQYLLQRLSVAVQRGNAGSVLGTIGHQDGL